MRKIIEIVGREQLVSKAGNPYERTHVLLDDGEECVGFGPDFAVDDYVEVFFHREMIKVRKPRKSTVDIEPLT